MAAFSVNEQASAKIASLNFSNINKSFGDYRVLKDVSFEARPGQVIALMGENGAGKSTLMKILAGFYPAGEFGGAMTLTDSLGFQSILKFTKPSDASQWGISMIHQELGLFPDLSASENLLLTEMSWQMRGEKLHQEAQSFLEDLFPKTKINVRTLVRDLSCAQAQMIEIARAVRSKSKVFIMDEPTSALTDVEAEELFRIIASLKAKGAIIFYISHRMSEIRRVADRILVLRDGTLVGEMDAASCPTGKVMELMVGRPLEEIYPAIPLPAKGARKILQLNSLSLRAPFLDKISFHILEGEILGLAGLMGSGRSEIGLALFGAMPEAAIEARFSDVKTGALYDYQPASPLQAMTLGISMLCEDRKLQGLCLNRSVLENLLLARNALCGDLSTFKKTTLPRDLADEKDFHEHSVASFRIKAQGAETPVENLSGGNQQKVLLARCLSIAPRLLILDEPTRGVDVGAKLEIYALIAKLAAQGMGILLISSDLPEVLGLSHRILTLHDGRITGEFSRDHALPQGFDPKQVMNSATQVGTL